MIGFLWMVDSLEPAAVLLLATTLRSTTRLSMERAPWRTARPPVFRMRLAGVWSTASAAARFGPGRRVSRPASSSRATPAGATGPRTFLLWTAAWAEPAEVQMLRTTRQHTSCHIKVCRRWMGARTSAMRRNNAKGSSTWKTEDTAKFGSDQKASAPPLPSPELSASALSSCRPIPLRVMLPAAVAMHLTTIPPTISWPRMQAPLKIASKAAGRSQHAKVSSTALAAVKSGP
mmetsp:Transcript_26159/g.62365  ORF Transcript_26159/g.62365 Transcript_26159/m.62365 type:complete len:232 (+) Transcript_26159:213-908(+)